MTARPSAIITYHSLDNSGSVISTPPALFRRQMEFVAASGIPVVPLEQVEQYPGSIAITFDDGFQNLLDHAIPVLEHHRFPTTIFIVSRYCGRHNNWPGQDYVKVPDLPLLSWSQLSGLPAAVSLGSHSISHPDLTRLNSEECERELRGCRDEIEQHTGRSVRSLAYPYGVSSALVRDLARRHFDLAVGTSLRLLRGQHDRMNLPRIDAYYLRGWFPIERLLTSAGNLYLTFRFLLREVRGFAYRRHDCRALVRSS